MIAEDTPNLLYRRNPAYMKLETSPLFTDVHSDEAAILTNGGKNQSHLNIYSDKKIELSE